MDISNILRPEQLPFKAPADLELAINELLEAWSREVFRFDLNNRRIESA